MMSQLMEEQREEESAGWRGRSDLRKVLILMLKFNCCFYKARQFKMNKSGCMQLTLSKPSSKQLAKIKDKLRSSQEHRAKQYESMCEEGKHSHSIIPFPHKERRISKKQIKHHSPARLLRSKSKQLDQSIKKHSEQKLQKGNISELYSELMTVKSEYKTLKQSYNKLIIQKNQLTQREQTEKEAIQAELQQRAKELERYQRMAQGFDQQIERIKRECYKLIENERLKNKKLEETIQEKDLMIAYLRNEVDKSKRGQQTTLASINQSSIFLTNNPFPFQQPTSHALSNVIVEEISHPYKREGRAEEDSLSFSRDKSKEMDSIHSFLTAQDQSINIPTRKDIVIVETHSSCHENDSDQCLTFEHRGEEEGDETLKSSFKPAKGSVISQKGKKSAHTLPPKNGSKVKGIGLHKKERIETDENNYVDSNKHDLLDSKKNMNSSLSSRHHKKATSKKKKI